jgi:hypothetical protein
MSAADLTELIPDTIVILTTFALTVSLATVNFSLYSDTAETVQEDTYRSIVISENMLEEGSGQYLHRSGRSVIDEELFKNAEIEDGKCYLDSVERLDGGNFSLRVSTYSGTGPGLDTDIPDPCRRSPSSSVYGATTPITLKKSSDAAETKRLLPSQVSVFALE